MKGLFIKLIIISLVIFTGQAFANTLFVNSTGVAPTNNPVFEYNVAGTWYKEGQLQNAIMPQDDNIPPQLISYTNFRFTITNVDGRRWRWDYDITTRNLNPDGSLNSESFSNSWGNLTNWRQINEPVCEAPYTYMHNNLCYDPFELQQNDSCEGNNFIPALGATEQNICAVMGDGSRCSATQDPTNSNFYIVGFESTCYDTLNNSPVVNPFNTSPAPNACKTDPSGQIMCSVDGSNSNGFDDDKYCGTYDIGNGTTSICFDNDEDLDLVPNHLDPDIDDDGIPNIDDPDANGNGIDDITEGYGSGGSGGSGGGGQPCTGENCQPSGGGGATNIDLTPVTQRLDTLLNQFRSVQDPTQALINDLEQSKQAEQQAIEEFFAKDNEELGFDGIETTAFDDLKNAFNTSSSCVNPVLYNQTIDLCGKAPTIQSWLNYIFAFLTLIYVYREVTDTVSNK